MRIASAAGDVNSYRYNYQSLKNALRELQIDFKEGPKEFIMTCFFNPDCATGKRSLYVNHQLKPGVFHCFKCDAKGNFDAFVSTYTKWTALRVLGFLRKHRECEVDPDDDGRVYRSAQAINDDYLGQFNHRHAYCADRGIDEPTLRRFKVGYDPQENDIIMPWFDSVGRLGAIKRRSVATKYYRFETDRDIRALLYGLHLVRPRSVVWISEGEFDTLWLSQAFKRVHKDAHASVALGGKYLNTLALAKLLEKNPTAIVLALDNDDDGRAAQRVIHVELRKYVPVFELAYPDDIKDPNALSLEQVINAIADIEKQLTHYTSKNVLETGVRYNAWTSKS